MKIQWTFLLLALGCVRLVHAELPPIPEIVLPDPESTGPGAFPNSSVSGALYQVISPPGVINAGPNQDQILVSVPNAGSIAWTTNRYNEGDIALQLAPKDPVQANALLGTSPPWDGSAAPNEYKYESPTQPQTQVWTMSADIGMVMATAAQNIATWDDGIADYHPTVALGRASSGFGYGMTSGQWGRGGIDLNLGTWGSTDETNFSTATAWFPYEQGWIAGWVADPSSDGSGASGWSGTATRSPAFDTVDVADIMTWTDTTSKPINVENGAPYGGVGKFSLTPLGVNSATDGMLFTISDDGSSNTNVTAAAPLADGSGWLYTNREDSQADPLIVAASDQASFGFVYVPYTATNLIGGHIRGNGSAVKQVGDVQVAQTGVGTYELSIGGKTSTDGVLLLANADRLAGSSDLADNNHLTYEWNAASGKFVIQAHHYDGEAKLEDTDFYFAWVDFKSPLTLAPPAFACGDFDKDRDVDSADTLTFLSNWTGSAEAGAGNLASGVVGPARSGQGALAAVPEPGSLILVLVGASLAWLGRRRQH
ncbi:MAG: PEP-CTERM sorting domain-containing protein [Pirellulales bacterium]